MAAVDRDAGRSARPTTNDLACRWYVARDGETTGPYSYDELLEEARDGRFRPVDHVWRPGFEQWIAVGARPDLVAVLPARPPLGLVPLTIEAAAARITEDVRLSRDLVRATPAIPRVPTLDSVEAEAIEALERTPAARLAAIAVEPEPWDPFAEIELPPEPMLDGLEEPESVAAPSARAGRFWLAAGAVAVAVAVALLSFPRVAGLDSGERRSDAARSGPPGSVTAHADAPRSAERRSAPVRSEEPGSEEPGSDAAPSLSHSASHPASAPGETARSRPPDQARARPGDEFAALAGAPAPAAPPPAPRLRPAPRPEPAGLPADVEVALPEHLGDDQAGAAVARVASRFGHCLRLARSQPVVPVGAVVTLEVGGDGVVRRSEARGLRGALGSCLQRAAGHAAFAPFLAPSARVEIQFGGAGTVRTRVLPPGG